MLSVFPCNFVGRIIGNYLKLLRLRKRTQYWFKNVASSGYISFEKKITVNVNPRWRETDGVYCKTNFADLQVLPYCDNWLGYSPRFKKPCRSWKKPTNFPDFFVGARLTSPWVGSSVHQISKKELPNLKHDSSCNLFWQNSWYKSKPFRGSKPLVGR